MIFERGDPDTEKRTWREVLRDGKQTARISCPVCGLAATLDPHPTSGHVVHEDGSVTPSIVCVGKTEDGDACPFHDYVELRGWVPRENQG